MTAGTTNRTVYPSAGAFAAASCPTLPPAPPRFSTTFGWPVCSASLEDTMRVTTSAGPPGGKGTIQRIGFDGNDCACAACASSAAQKKIAAFIAAIVAARPRLTAAEAAEAARAAAEAVEPGSAAAEAAAGHSPGAAR